MELILKKVIEEERERSLKHLQRQAEDIRREGDCRLANLNLQ